MLNNKFDEKIMLIKNIADKIIIKIKIFLLSSIFFLYKKYKKSRSINKIFKFNAKLPTIIVIGTITIKYLKIKLISK